MKRRHAKGYKDYARLDGLRYHPAQDGGGYDSDGVPYCVCSYPLVMTPEERKEYLRRTEAPWNNQESKFELSRIAEQGG